MTIIKMVKKNYAFGVGKFRSKKHKGGSFKPSLKIFLPVILLSYPEQKLTKILNVFGQNITNKPIRQRLFLLFLFVKLPKL